MTSVLEEVPFEAFHKTYENWEEHYNERVATQEGYFEGYSVDLF